jgi:hypothetical protein
MVMKYILTVVVCLVVGVAHAAPPPPPCPLTTWDTWDVNNDPKMVVNPNVTAQLTRTLPCSARADVVVSYIRRDNYVGAPSVEPHIVLTLLKGDTLPFDLSSNLGSPCKGILALDAIGAKLTLDAPVRGSTGCPPKFNPAFNIAIH